MGRGRKADPNKQYFNQVQEKAVKEFLESDDEKFRNDLFNKYLSESLNKMIYGIYYKYKLFRDGYTYEEVRDDTLSHLMDKFNHFNPELNNKAFSYYQTIVKNYMLGNIKKDKKLKKIELSFEENENVLTDSFEFSNDIEYKENNIACELFVEIKDEVYSILNNKHLNPPLTEKERRVGCALIDLLDNWKDIFSDALTKNSKKFDKRIMFLFFGELTGYKTREIKIALRRYKMVFKYMKEKKLTDNE